MFKIAIRTMLNNYEYQYHALVIGLVLLPISVRVRYIVHFEALYIDYRYTFCMEVAI